jgi:creatinine amidohydrolase
VLLEELTWPEAETVLTKDAVVVIPLGAAAKEHGPHLKLSNDWVMVEYLKRRVLQLCHAVVAPTVSYHFYPAFDEYPGSTTLGLDTARDLVVEVCRSIARHGSRRFYVLNTGISTIRALEPAAEILATAGILLHYTDLRTATEDVEQAVSEQEGGTHADEIETSIMLHIAPDMVDMSRAVRDYHPGRGKLTRDPEAEGIYSETGVYGDPTLASAEKGARIVEALVAGIVADIEELRRSPLPST